ncbi:MAG: ABC transporter ATP-binding protein [Pseudomonadota bacterium]
MSAAPDMTGTGGRQATAAPFAIELKGISKAFGAVQANKDINIAVKSTLMSILYGFYKADAGQILINGAVTPIPDSQSAIRAGIGMVFQHFKLVQNFTVLENVVLGAEDGPLLNTSLAKARRLLTDLAREYELEVDPDAMIEDLSVGHQQRVEILKALYRQADILILDEPTGVLTPDEADHLFRILKGLKDQGKTVILITHKLHEIMDATDNVSVMRRGTMVGTVKTAETSPEALAELMVGRKVLLEVEKRPAKTGALILSVENLAVKDDHGVERLKGVSFDIRAGEILGIAGVAGNGQSELLAALGGITRATGKMVMNGVELPLRGAGADGQSRRAAGIAHVPEDRQHLGLIMDFTAWENIAFGYHNAPEYQRNALFMDNDALRNDARAKIERFDVRPADCWLPAKSFSGGNQQKIVVAREIEQDPELLLIGQPTRGVDIGAIEFIHKQIIALRDQGRAILLVSVELDEIMSLSDRIAVMFDGRIMGFKDPAKTNERELGLMMAGMTGAEPAKGAA